MAQNVIEGDLFVNGMVQAGSFNPGDNTIGGTKLNPADPAGVSKTVHRNVVTLGQVQSAIATAERRPVYCAKSIGNLSRVRIGCVIAPTGDSTATVDIYKNGTTILSAAVVLNNANTAYIPVAGTPVSSGVYAADAVFEVVVTVSPGTGTPARGLFVNMTFDENP